MANILFSDIEKLLIALGSEKIEGSGSRVAFSKDNETVFFHRPHPQKEAKKYQIEMAREFLERIDHE
ncbi:MAG: type II toxin-antitoxin system HicA family toxin [Pyrinomonadaceae bacterium]